MTGSTDPFETLVASETPRRLQTSPAELAVGAKLLRAVDGDEYLIVHVALGEHAPRTGAGGAILPPRSLHLALDSNLALVTIGAARRERDSFEHLRRALALRDVKLPGGEGSRTRYFNSEFAGVGNQTLKTWLRFWRNPSSQARAETHESGRTREEHMALITAELHARGVAFDE